MDSHHPAFPITDDLVQRLIVGFIEEGNHFEPNDHGHIALIEEHETQRFLEEIWPDPDGWTLLDIPWEGLRLEDSYYQAVFLANNEFGIVFIIPDKPWIEGALRNTFNNHLVT